MYWNEKNNDGKIQNLEDENFYWHEFYKVAKI
jgi:hypothetical protein